MENSREDQIARVNARYNDIKNKIRDLKSTINTKKANNEDVQDDELQLKELISNLQTTVVLLNNLRAPPGNTGNDKEPVNFILDILSSSFEGLMSTSLGPLELLIQLVNFFITTFINFVKDLFRKIKDFIRFIFDELRKLFPQIDILYNAVRTIDVNNQTVQRLWYSLIELVTKGLKDIQNIFFNFEAVIVEFVKAIISNLKEFVDVLFNEIKKLFPEISTLYDAVSTIENTSKKTQGLFNVMVEVFLSVIRAFQSIFSGFLKIFLDRISFMDDNVKLFNDQVSNLMKLANLNNEIVNTTKTAFNTSINTLKGNLSNLRNKINAVSGKKIDIPHFGNVSGPSFDTSGLNTAINNLKTIK